MLGSSPEAQRDRGQEVGERDHCPSIEKGPHSPLGLALLLFWLCDLKVITQGHTGFLICSAMK
jgi:hypothetical protein